MSIKPYAHLVYLQEKGPTESIYTKCKNNGYLKLDGSIPHHYSFWVINFMHLSENKIDEENIIIYQLINFNRRENL